MAKKRERPKNTGRTPGGTLANRIRDARKQAGLTLDQLADESKLSKTYLWELENDEKGEKRPSADTLMKLVGPLRVTIADLLGLPSVQVDNRAIEISKSLKEFCDWMKKTDRELSEDEVHDLATMRFRGGQPKTAEDWEDLYRTLKRTTGR
ncbi:anaerobic benzoate catabolism transcriptional regulator [Stieleria neptunia]|uniref:Anaerobic benzoate catabolism transcriptional regulator n=1 Tax=Stieleria neptunia TaxID=2527979 RepID=A0A518HSZ0_9BACT|nr:helix-turn-helix transcriptional regulator [Stieleria neptunia]QDV43938.1 anaerobic benzoate catabolism transcriptional regulator [Stieleria neptunia]